MKHWQILITFGMRQKKKIWRKCLSFWPSHFNTVAILPCKMQKS